MCRARCENITYVLCTGPGKRMVPTLRELFRQGQAEVVSNSKNKILATWEPVFFAGPCMWFKALILLLRTKYALRPELFFLIILLVNNILITATRVGPKPQEALKKSDCGKDMQMTECLKFLS